MDKETFFQRLASLLQKSRKAQRLYSNMGRVSSDASPYSETQIEEWRAISSDIVRQLSAVIDRPYSKTIVSDVVAIRDNFYHVWRSSESALHKMQRDLISSSERGDFVKAVSLAEEAVGLKARVQAAHAAHHEFSEILRGSKVGQEPIELTSEQILPFERDYDASDFDKLDEVIERRAQKTAGSRQGQFEEAGERHMAKVIPLRRA